MVTTSDIEKKVLDAIQVKPGAEYRGPMYSYRSDEYGWPWKDLYEGGQVKVPGLGTLRIVEKWEQGQEDSWDDKARVMVFNIDSGGQLFQKTGWRDSWDSYYHHDGPLVEVVRYEKTVVAYREKS